MARFLSVMAFASVLTAQADTLTWGGAAGADWNTASNWSPAKVPTAADDVVFTGDATPSVTTADASAGNVKVTSGTVSVTGNKVFRLNGTGGTGIIDVAEGAEMTIGPAFYGNSGAGEKFIAAAKRLADLSKDIRGDARRFAALKEAGIGEYVGRAFLTAANVKDGEALLQDCDDAKSDAECAAIRKKVVAITRKEYASTLAVRRLVTKDSRLGWEPRMKYYGGIEQIDWKLRRMEELYGDAVR